LSCSSFGLEKMLSTAVKSWSRISRNRAVSTTALPV
jgi:hypothetical protein